MNNTIPQYSDEAKINRALFYSNLQDINIFVEDENKEYLYDVLFRRLLGDSVKIKCIFPTGGKNRLRHAYDEFGTGFKYFKEEKNVYFADGDFDKYIDEVNMIKDKCFVYLEKYNIEGYLIDKNAVIEYLMGKWYKQYDYVDEILNFDYWKITACEYLYKLFLVYLLIKRDRPCVASVGNQPTKFFDNNTAEFYQDKYDEMLNSCGENVQEHLEEVEKIVREKSIDIFDIICGKYLLKHLEYVIRCKKREHNFNKAEVRSDDLIFDLMRNFDIAQLDYVKNRIFDIFKIK